MGGLYRLYTPFSKHAQNGAIGLPAPSVVAPCPRGAAVASLCTDLSPSSVVVRCGAPGATKPGAANNMAPQPAAAIMERRDIVGGTESKLLSQIWAGLGTVVFNILVGDVGAASDTSMVVGNRSLMFAHCWVRYHWSRVKAALLDTL